MKKYETPLLNISKFFCENVVTESAVAHSAYAEEVQTILGTMTSEQYATRTASIKRILEFSQ